MNDIQGFTFYKSYWESLSEFSINDKEEMLIAIVDFVFNDKEPLLTGFKKTIWVLMKPNLQASKNKSHTKPNENQTKSKTKAKQKQTKTNDLYDKDKELEIDIDNKKDKILKDIPLDWQEIINIWLNYKKDRKESYKSNQSIMIMFKKLVELSNDNLETAKKIIEQSIANNWAGIFELKQTVKKGLTKNKYEEIKEWLDS
jgi:tRNA U34 5-carboxymethylaminomethyl modifying enzyme MnmG/GidA